MNAFRKVLLWITSGGLLGALVGAVGGQFFVPKFNAPISGVYAQCDCASVTLGTAAAMFKWVLIGILLGGVGGLVLGLIGAMAREKKSDAPPAASAKS
jgi:hypothetical protein